jgi:hypothetical protein
MPSAKVMNWIIYRRNFIRCVLCKMNVANQAGGKRFFSISSTAQGLSSSIRSHIDTNALIYLPIFVNYITSSP